MNIESCTNLKNQLCVIQLFRLPSPPRATNVMSEGRDITFLPEGGMVNEKIEPHISDFSNWYNFQRP